MKINGWQRIGIVASVIWIVGAGLYTLERLSDEDIKTAGFFYGQCASIRDETYHAHSVSCARGGENNIDEFNKCMVPYNKELEQLDDKCTKEGQDYVINAVPRERLGAAVIAFGPVPVAWGGAYFALFVFRWVRRGWN